MTSQFCFFSSGSEESRAFDTAKLNFPWIQYEIDSYEFYIQLFLLNSLETWTKTWSVEVHKDKDVQEQAKMNKEKLHSVKDEK